MCSMLVFNLNTTSEDSIEILRKDLSSMTTSLTFKFHLEDKLKFFYFVGVGGGGVLFDPRVQ